MALRFSESLAFNDLPERMYVGIGQIEFCCIGLSLFRSEIRAKKATLLGVAFFKKIF